MKSIQIRNSYKVIYTQGMIYLLYDYCVPQKLNRSVDSLVREWKGHNLLYNLGLFRDHTTDVDFEENPKWYMSVIWFILSLFYIEL